MDAMTRQERYRRRVLLKARLYDRIVEALGPLRKSNDEIERILSDIDDAELGKGCEE